MPLQAATRPARRCTGDDGVIVVCKDFGGDKRVMSGLHQVREVYFAAGRHVKHRAENTVQAASTMNLSKDETTPDIVASSLTDYSDLAAFSNSESSASNRSMVSSIFRKAARNFRCSALFSFCCL